MKCIDNNDVKNFFSSPFGCNWSYKAVLSDVWAYVPDGPAQKKAVSDWNLCLHQQVVIFISKKSLEIMFVGFSWNYPYSQIIRL